MFGIVALDAVDQDLRHRPTVSIDTDYLGTMDVQLDPPQMVG